MSDEKVTRKICSKERPFVPPIEPGVVWEHQDAYEKNPEYDFSIVAFHCPNCGTDFRLDLGD